MEKDPSIQRTLLQIAKLIGRGMLKPFTETDAPSTTPGLVTSVNDAMYGRFTPLPDTGWQLAVQDIDNSLSDRSK